MTPPATTRLFSTVLVANRGEIACRIIRTLRALGIRSVAVYSDADRAARHVAEADVAVRVGPPEPQASYLDVDAIVAAALRTGAEAIHPGYGFLSESAGLARACAAAGVAFVGPGVEALELMGDKIRAKTHVARAGIPVIPGVDRRGLTDEDLVQAAEGVGFPLLIKPSAGGGGKGMHVVEHPDELRRALAGARRVAAAAFGDDTLFLERYLSSPRHIEVQVLADTAGTVLHLGERECSLQRRHQKVVEEAPSPFVGNSTRRRIGEMACDVARSVGYAGAGTVELLVSAEAPEDFFFMEMNTRLQVEHPVTEMVTGIDLVEWQLRVAAGEPLALAQHEIRITGHAVEARVYAESSARGFLPATGTVLALREPTGEGIRVDSSLVRGLEVGSRYDPMLAKVIAWAPDRDEAVARLDAALAATTILGVDTNLDMLRDLLGDDDVRSGRLDTGLVERLLARREQAPADPAALVAAALWASLGPVGAGRPEAAAARPLPGPWDRDGWRLGDPQPTRYSFATAAGTVVDVMVRGDAHDATVAVDGSEPVRASLHRQGPDAVTVEVDGVVRPFRIVSSGEVTWVGAEGRAVELRLRGRAHQLADELALIVRTETGTDPEVRAPMPGTVVAVDVATGDHVVAGQSLLTIEAMKMEHRLAAPSDGIVTITVRPADLVKLDHVVATVTPHPHEGTPE